MPSENPSVWNPGFEFLEDDRILALDNLMNEIISADTAPEKRTALFAQLETDWDRVWSECLHESESDDASMKRFLDFFSYNLRKLSAGGMNRDRTAIGRFLSQKEEEIAPYAEKFHVDET